MKVFIVALVAVSMAGRKLTSNIGICDRVRKGQDQCYRKKIWLPYLWFQVGTQAFYAYRQNNSGRFCGLMIKSDVRHVYILCGRKVKGIHF